MPLGFLTMASTVAEDFGFPFQIQSVIPPPVRTGSDRSLGAAWSSLTTSNRLDLPDPLGPIRTLRAESSRSMPSGPERQQIPGFDAFQGRLFGVVAVRSWRTTSGALSLAVLVCHGTGACAILSTPYTATYTIHCNDTRYPPGAPLPMPFENRPLFPFTAEVE